MTTPSWKRIRVDWQELEDAFEDASVDHRYYLDRETGAVHFFSSYLDNEEEEEDEKAITSEERYVLIPQARRTIPFADLVAFVASLGKGDEHERLESVLEAAGGYEHFREVIEDLPAARRRWHAFVQGRLEERIKEWLAEVGVEPLE